MRSRLQWVVVSLAVLIAPGVAQAGTISYQAGSEQHVLVLLNQIRQQKGLSALALSAPLRISARSHSADMLRSSSFTHSSSTETQIARTPKGALTGETIAWGVGSYGSPAGLVGQWMRSASHRAVILTQGSRRVGIGIALGTFGSTRNTVMATAGFSS
jgi:uncharacterized protein YkwD